MDSTVLFIGAGFSAAARIPTTGELLDEFAKTSRTTTTSDAVQAVITNQLEQYWKQVFGWESGKPNPTFEDHFTSLDLAANTGHQLGPVYTPSRLRAIRRFSLHRAFETLDRRFSLNSNISSLLRQLSDGNGTAVVSTNWDIVVEKHLHEMGVSYDYGIPSDVLGHGPMSSTGLKVLKLHGSANWCYCDSCRRIFSYPLAHGKGAYKVGLFLERRDFEALIGAADAARLAADLPDDAGISRCSYCGIRLSARVATFSFEKALGFFQFQGVWEEALRVMRAAERWIFIGYSLPEADFELRHLLKTAQHAGPQDRQLAIDVVLLDDLPALDRFQRFFGAKLSSTFTTGFDSWFASTT